MFHILDQGLVLSFWSEEFLDILSWFKIPGPFQSGFTLTIRMTAKFRILVLYSIHPVIQNEGTVFYYESQFQFTVEPCDLKLN